MLTAEEKKRYNRHLILDQIGEAGQEKLKAAKVLVVGAGGLGCPVLQYLTAAGVGTIGIIDGDIVDESNLQRQILFNVDDIGKSKALCASEHLAKLNPFIQFEVYNQLLNIDNAVDLVGGYDIILDGTDNFPTRYLVNDACVVANKPFISASIFKFEGQLSVYNVGDGPTYRCLFPEPPEEGEVPSCSEVGVVGVLPGILGTFQANETIKYICKIGDLLVGKLLTIDALSLGISTFKFGRQHAYTDLQLQSDYSLTCETDEDNISVQAFKRLLDSGQAVSILDVRNPDEYRENNIGGVLIPLGELEQRCQELDKNKTWYVHCKMGGRSAKAITVLKKHGFTHLINVEGGLDALIGNT